MKILKKIIILILGIYLFLNLFLFFNQKQMLYFPDKTNFFDCDNFTKNQKKMALFKQYNIDTKFYQVNGKKNNVIIFFHGNAGRACDRTGILKILKNTGNTIIFTKYYGYADGEENTPNINEILKNVEAIGSYIETQEFEKIYVMGRSLGTGPASYFAENYKTDKLLLISAYDELYKVAGDKYPIFPIKYLFTQNYNSINYLKNYKKDFLLIHGKKDKVITYKHGLDLYKNLENINKNIISLENGTHHNIFEFIEIRKKIVEFFNF